MKTIVFTGGHHSSSLQVATKLVSQGWHVVWFGHKFSMWHDKNVSGEYLDVLKTGITFIDLKAGKFYRTYNPLKLVRIPFGFFQALFHLLKLRHQSNLLGIFSSGGYLAVPTVIAGWLLGIPSITHEQTVVTGWANKFISLFVKKVAVSWPSSSSNPKVIYTGLPLRPELINYTKNTDSVPPIIYITGGKQGSHRINEVVFSALPELLKKYRVIHQTGSTSVYSDQEIASKITDSNYTYFPYDSARAIDALLISTLVVSRSGAHTVYELAALNKKAVLIPIPWVSHNEQYHNATVLEKNHQAIILTEKELTANSLQIAISSGLNLTPLGITVPLDATEKLVDLVKDTFL